MSSIFLVDHNLERLRYTEVVEVDILGGCNPEEGLVVGSPGRSLEGIGCMGLTWLSGEW